MKDEWRRSVPEDVGDKLKAKADARLANPGKLRRFELRTTEELEGFKERQLNDTRYASKLACDLVGTLFGGRDVQTDSGTHQVVFASSGMVTTKLRQLWGLEAILREAAPSAGGVTQTPTISSVHFSLSSVGFRDGFVSIRRSRIESISRLTEPRGPSNLLSSTTSLGPTSISYNGDDDGHIYDGCGLWSV